MSAGRWIAPAGIALGLGVVVIGWLRQPAATPVAPAPAGMAAVTPAPTSLPVPDGEALFNQHCATCHMADGGGVPNFQPPILDSPVLAAERERLVAVIRAGSAALKDRPNPMGWEMPPFGFLPDPELNALVDYVRQRFGPAGSSTPAP